MHQSIWQLGFAGPCRDSLGYNEQANYNVTDALTPPPPAAALDTPLRLL